MVRLGSVWTGIAGYGTARTGLAVLERHGKVRFGPVSYGSHGCVCLVGQGFCWERLDMAVMECIVRVRHGTEVFGSEWQSWRG